MSGEWHRELFVNSRTFRERIRVLAHVARLLLAVGQPFRQARGASVRPVRQRREARVLTSPDGCILSSPSIYRGRREAARALRARCIFGRYLGCGVHELRDCQATYDDCAHTLLFLHETGGLWARLGFWPSSRQRSRIEEMAGRSRREMSKEGRSRGRDKVKWDLVLQTLVVGATMS